MESDRQTDRRIREGEEKKNPSLVRCSHLILFLWEGWVFSRCQSAELRYSLNLVEGTNIFSLHESQSQSRWGNKHIFFARESKKGKTDRDKEIKISGGNCITQSELHKWSRMTNKGSRTEKNLWCKYSSIVCEKRRANGKEYRMWFYCLSHFCCPLSQ